MASATFLVLLSLLAWGVFSLFVFSFKNGFIAVMQQAIDSGILLPSGEALRTEYTGISLIDQLLTSLTPFFYPLAEGNAPGLLLHSVNFAGCIGSLWTVVLLESLRSGNRGKLVTL
jgi:hypothetical protein